MQVLFIYYTIVGNLKHKEMNNGELETHDTDANEPLTISRHFGCVTLVLEPFGNNQNDFKIFNGADNLGSTFLYENESLMYVQDYADDASEYFLYACVWYICNDLEQLSNILIEMYNV